MSAHPKYKFFRLMRQNRIKTVNKIGQEFGVHPMQVGLWKKELQEQASKLFDAKRDLKPVDPSASPERLYS